MKNKSINPYETAGIHTVAAYLMETSCKILSTDGFCIWFVGFDVNSQRLYLSLYLQVLAM